MTCVSIDDVNSLMSLPPRGAWIEIILIWETSAKIESLPSRGAWIEIALPLDFRRNIGTSLPMVSVDQKNDRKAESEKSFQTEALLSYFLPQFLSKAGLQASKFLLSKLSCAMRRASPNSKPSNVG